MTFERLDPDERAAIATRLKAARYRAGLSVREVADALGVNKNSITDWQKGVLPGAESRAKLAALYGVPEDVLFAEVAAHEQAAAALLRPV